MGQQLEEWTVSAGGRDRTYFSASIPARLNFRLSHLATHLPQDIEDDVNWCLSSGCPWLSALHWSWYCQSG
jgi:hypothetical protein